MSSTATPFTVLRELMGSSIEMRPASVSPHWCLVGAPPGHTCSYLLLQLHNSQVMFQLSDESLRHVRDDHYKRCNLVTATEHLQEYIQPPFERALTGVVVADVALYIMDQQGICMTPAAGKPTENILLMRNSIIVYVRCVRMLLGLLYVVRYSAERIGVN